MTGYIVRRLGQAIVVTLGVTLITFALLHALPGGIARDILGNRASPQAIAAFNSEYGLDKSLWYQYWKFLVQLAHGNLGYSFQLDRSTDSLLAIDLPKDFLLGGLSLVLALAIAIPVGIAQAVRRNGLVDYAGTGVSFFLYSMPQYAIALILIQILAISFHIFPAVDPQVGAGSLIAHPKYLVLPVASLTLVTYATFSRYMRSSAIDTLAQDYIRTARAKGLPERLVLWRHLLRNSLIAVVTLVGVSIPYIITGTLIIEQVFNYPGAGLEYYNAALRSDYQVMLGITVLVGVITVVGNLIADIGYAILDPRIRY
ncbi:MAG TPA: ABC transporter permease [Acidimicrobiales bacterium]|nr:ABC transporter permease [Acidimicrobiales bacterium]